MASSIHAARTMHFMVVNRPVPGAVEKLGAGTMLAASLHRTGERNATALAIRSRGLVWAATASRHVSPLRLASFFGNIIVLQTPRRLERGGERQDTSAGVRKKVRKAFNDVRVSVQIGRTPDLLDYVSPLAVSLPLGLAAFEGLYLLSWVASLSELLPGSGTLFAAAHLIVDGIMGLNCTVGFYAMTLSFRGVNRLPDELTRKLKLPEPGILDAVFSLALSFVPFANLFLWSRFAREQRHLPTKAKAAVAATAFIYEAPRFFYLLLVLSGGLPVFRQVFVMCNMATFFGALHRISLEARVKNEKVLVEVCRLKKIAGKKTQDRKPSLEAKEKIDHLTELEEFDIMLAQRSPRHDTAVSAKVKNWSVGETMEWLGQQGLARYATTFAENSIDGEMLLQLTNVDLRDELKIVSFGDRKKLCLLIQQLQDSR